MAGFKAILGHEQIIEHLQNAVTMDKVSHAYIINGPDKSGKMMLAEAFAQTLECEKLEDVVKNAAQPSDVEPCMECHSCKQAMTKNQPDIIYVRHEKPNTISYAILILLTTNAAAFLPTILSRCVTLNIKAVPDEKIRGYLMRKYQIPDYQADVCVAFAQGNVGKAIQLASSEEFNELKDAVLQLIKRLRDIDLYEMTEAVKQIATYKLSINDYFDLMMVWYRDVLLFKATGDVNGLIFKDEVYDIKRQAEKSSYSGIETILEALRKAQIRLNANVNFDLTMELLLLTIKEN